MQKETKHPKTRKQPAARRGSGLLQFLCDGFRKNAELIRRRSDSSKQADRR